jgi:hypothetical protein
MLVKIYECFGVFWWFYTPKNKANSKPISSLMRPFCQWFKRLPRPFGPHNDLNISAPLCLSGFVAENQFEKTKPILGDEEQPESLNIRGKAVRLLSIRLSGAVEQKL